MEIKVNDWNLEICNDLLNKIEEEYKTKDIAPQKEDIFRALKLTSLEDTKVVIFGQDPYPTKGVATGLAFSSNGKLPASLRNMFKELESDLGIERVDTDLSDWAKQGVLLLNTTLTVEVGNANSHSKLGWISVTNQVIEQLNQKESPVIFVLLGGHAQKLEDKISQKHCILKYTHPSPLSAYRGFFGCNMYSNINTLLEKNKIEPINFGDKQTSLW